MKVFTILFCLVALGLSASCGKDNVVDNNEDYTPSIGGFDENGASNALFSVSENKQVRFSRGNLQYQASTDTWRFAEQQYSFAGVSNEGIADDWYDWIDLFGWGTSGWNSGATCYQPWSKIEGNDYYNPGGSLETDLTGDYAEADWAWHNPIVNGGNKIHFWRTMTYEEWKYLLEDRPDAEKKRGNAIVSNSYGLVILPDEWRIPNDVSFSPTPDPRENEYSMETWQKMEDAGAIFLPGAGVRSGGLISGFNSGDFTWRYGAYWTVCHVIDNDNNYVYHVTTQSKGRISWGPRWYGYSVRPVQDI